MTPHSRLAELLAVYAGSFPSERATVAMFREFLDSTEVLQGKSNPLRHVTSSSWIVSTTRQFVLLTHHAKLGIWVQLGGHTDEGEDWAQAALREAREESGLTSLRIVTDQLFDLDIHTIPARGETAAHRHYDLRFLVEADQNEPLIISPESHALSWVELTKLEDFTEEESQLRMRRKTGKPRDRSVML